MSGPPLRNFPTPGDADFVRTPLPTPECLVGSLNLQRTAAQFAFDHARGNDDYIDLRDIAERFGTARSTLVDHIEALEELGVLSVTPGTPGLPGDSKAGSYRWIPNVVGAWSDFVQLRVRREVSGGAGSYYRLLVEELLATAMDETRPHLPGALVFPANESRWASHELGMTAWAIVQAWWDRGSPEFRQAEMVAWLTPWSLKKTTVRDALQKLQRSGLAYQDGSSREWKLTIRGHVTTALWDAVVEEIQHQPPLSREHSLLFHFWDAVEVADDKLRARLYRQHKGEVAEWNDPDAYEKKIGRYPSRENAVRAAARHFGLKDWSGGW